MTSPLFTGFWRLVEEVERVQLSRRVCERKWRGLFRSGLKPVATIKGRKIRSVA
jgi:hypothetical protein